MKLVLVRIRRGDPSKGEPQMVYPARFNAQEVHARGVGHVGGVYGYSGHMALGADEEWTIIGVDDALADEYDADPDMMVISEAEADAYFEEWRVLNNRPSVLVRDPERLRMVALKRDMGMELTPEDLAALDPESQVPGVNRIPKPSEVVAKAAQAQMHKNVTRDAVVRAKMLRAKPSGKGRNV